jgi:uncharacterized protein YndB with AHSA1/START domain
MSASTSGSTRQEPGMSEMVPVEVTVHVASAPDDVFRYFTDPVRYIQWTGSEAEFEPVPGGVYRVRMRDGFSASGQFLEVARPHRVAFS